MNIASLKFSPLFRPKLGEDQKKGLHSNLVRFSAQNLVKTKKKSFLKFSSIFIGAGQKQRSSFTICVLEAYAQLTKRGGHSAKTHGPMAPS